MITFVVFSTALTVLVSSYLWTYLSSPLKAFPSGHWSSGFSNIWRLLNVWTRKAQYTHMRLHDDLGSAVRMGPNIVSITDPTALKDVFRITKPWKKTPFYGVNDVMVNGQRVSNVFGTTNEEWHTTVMRPIKGLYSMTRALDMEPHIDTTLREWTSALTERFASKGKSVDLGDWFPFFTWDSMGRQTFGETYGLMEAGSDHQGLIATSTAGLDYFAPVTQIPTLDLLLDKNPVKRVGPPSFGWATAQAFGAVAKRNAEPTKEAVTRQSDFLDKFLEGKKDHPNIVNDFQVVNYLLVNILAGSDTTGIYCIAAAWYTLKTPGVLKRVRQELDALAVEGPVSWKDTQRLPYFRAVMQEADRMHPGVGIMLERYVPAEGYTLPDGRFLPGGTIVGCNPWAVNRREDVFGSQPHEFKPERWMQQVDESEEQFNTRVRKMLSVDMTFGAGKRTCLGKNVGLLTATKAVATLFNTYDVSLADPNKEWTVHNSWFVYQYDIKVNLNPRNTGASASNGQVNGIMRPDA